MLKNCRCLVSVIFIFLMKPLFYLRTFCRYEFFNQIVFNRYGFSKGRIFKKVPLKDIHLVDQLVVSQLSLYQNSQA